MQRPLVSPRCSKSQWEMRKLDSWPPTRSAPRCRSGMLEIACNKTWLDWVSICTSDQDVAKNQNKETNQIVDGNVWRTVLHTVHTNHRPHNEPVTLYLDDWWAKWSCWISVASSGPVQVLWDNWVQKQVITHLYCNGEEELAFGKRACQIS